MSIDVANWRAFKQTTGSCILASYGVASAYFGGPTPTTIFSEYCRQNGGDPSPPATEESETTRLFEIEVKKSSGYKALAALHERGKGCLAVARGKFYLRTFTYSSFGELRNTLAAEEAIALLCLDAILPGTDFHSIAVAADINADVWVNDTNFGLIHAALESDLWSKYPGIGRIGDAFLLRPHRDMFLDAPSAVAGSAEPVRAN